MKIRIGHNKYGFIFLTNVRLIQKAKRVSFMKSDIFVYIGKDINNLETHCYDSRTLYGIDYISNVRNKIHTFGGLKK